LLPGHVVILSPIHLNSHDIAISNSLKGFHFPEEPGNIHGWRGDYGIVCDFEPAGADRFPG